MQCVRLAVLARLLGVDKRTMSRAAQAGEIRARKLSSWRHSPRSKSGERGENLHWFVDLDECARVVAAMLAPEAQGRAMRTLRRQAGILEASTANVGLSSTCGVAR